MSSATIRSITMRAGAAAAIVALAACSTDTPTSPAPRLRAPAEPSNTVIITTAGNGANAATLHLCKWSTTQTAVSFTVTATGAGSIQGGSPRVITPNAPLAGFPPYVWQACADVLADPAVGNTTVTITETVPSGQTLDVITGDGNAVAFTSSTATGIATITLNNTQEAHVYFKNSGTSVPNVGCSLTQGYWKTHVAGKKLDPTWSTLASGPATKFFNGNLNAAGNGFFGTTAMDTWLEIFNTPVAGDRRIALAYQFMAAYLNKANGASLSGTGVQDAFNGASAYFLGTPATIEQINAWQSTLGSYNEGTIGPGHCAD